MPEAEAPGWKGSLQQTPAEPAATTPETTPDDDFAALNPSLFPEEPMSSDSAAGHAERARAARLKETAAGRVREEAGRQKEHIATELRTASSALRSSSDQIDRNTGWAGSVLSQVADSIEHAAETLETQDPDALVGSVRRLARENPAMFLAGCAIAGFAAARILKAEPTEESYVRH